MNNNVNLKKLDNLFKNFIFEQNEKQAPKQDMQVPQNSSPQKESDEIERVIEEIKKKLDSADLFGQNERIKNKIIKYLNVLKNNEQKLYENYETLERLLKSEVNLKDSYATELCEELDSKFDATEVKYIIKYLENRTLNIEQFCNKRIKFDDLFNASDLLRNLSPELRDYLKYKQFVSIPVMGKTELLFAMLFDQGRKPSNAEHGDVVVKQEGLEVKTNKARIGGQKGFGKGFLVARYFKNAFKQEAQKNGLSGLSSQIDKLSNDSFNLTARNLQNYTNSFLILCNKTNMDEETAREKFKNGFKELYVDDNAFDQALAFSNFIDDYLVATTGGNKYQAKINKYYGKVDELEERFKAVKSSGKTYKDPEYLNVYQQLNLYKKKIKDLENADDAVSEDKMFSIQNIGEFFLSFLAFSMKYYQIIEHFKYFALSNDDEFVILNEEAMNDASLIKKYLSPNAVPSFADNANEQSIKFSVELK